MQSQQWNSMLCVSISSLAQAVELFVSWPLGVDYSFLFNNQTHTQKHVCRKLKGGLYLLGVWTQWACRRYDAVNFNLYHILKRGSADVIPRHNARGTITNKLDCVIAGSVGLRGSDYNFINSNSVLHLPNKYRKYRKRTISRYFFPTLWALRPILRCGLYYVRPILRCGLYYGAAYTTVRPILRAACTTAVLF